MIQKSKFAVKSDTAAVRRDQKVQESAASMEQKFIPDEASCDEEPHQTFYQLMRERAKTESQTIKRIESCKNRLLHKAQL